MIIAFSSDDKKGLESVLAYHFGRCPYFTFVELEENKVKNIVVEDNPYANSHEAGVVPQYIHNKGAEMIVAGGMGPSAQEWFSQLGVKPMVGSYGKIKDLVAAIAKGPMEISTPSTAIEEHSEGGIGESERLGKEVTHLREVIANLNERLKKLENK